MALIAAATRIADGRRALFRLEDYPTIGLDGAANSWQVGCGHARSARYSSAFDAAEDLMGANGWRLEALCGPAWSVQLNPIPRDHPLAPWRDCRLDAEWLINPLDKS